MRAVWVAVTLVACGGSTVTPAPVEHVAVVHERLLVLVGGAGEPAKLIAVDLFDDTTRVITTEESSDLAIVGARWAGDRVVLARDAVRRVDDDSIVEVIDPTTSRSWVLSREPRTLSDVVVSEDGRFAAWRCKRQQELVDLCVAAVDGSGDVVTLWVEAEDVFDVVAWRGDEIVYRSAGVVWSISRSGGRPRSLDEPPAMASGSFVEDEKLYVLHHGKNRKFELGAPVRKLLDWRR